MTDCHNTYLHTDVLGNEMEYVWQVVKASNETFKPFVGCLKYMYKTNLTNVISSLWSLAFPFLRSSLELNGTEEDVIGPSTSTATKRVCGWSRHGVGSGGWRWRTSLFIIQYHLGNVDV